MIGFTWLEPFNAVYNITPTDNKLKTLPKDEQLEKLTPK